MVAAMRLGLDDQGPSLSRDLGAKARSGDPAADDDHVKIGHFRRWLRIGKPRRLGVAVMFNGGFTDLLLLPLAAILVVAAVIDVRTFTISNRLNLTVTLLAPVYWLAVPLSLWEVPIQLGAAAIVFGVLAAAFYAGM